MTTMFRAEWRNQYSRPLGVGFDAVRETAIHKATEAANKELASANPSWRWRKSKLRVEAWEKTGETMHIITPQKAI